MLVVDKNYKCIGLLTVKDIEKAERSLASKDKMGRLLVGAAVGVGDKEGIKSRVKCLKNGSRYYSYRYRTWTYTICMETLKKNKKIFPNSEVIVENILATSEVANELIKNGVTF